MRDQYKTGEGSPDDDDSYLGYSVTTVEFDGDNADVAVGMPRGAGLNGKVLVYNRNLTNTYRDALKGRPVLLNNSQARPGRNVSQPRAHLLVKLCTTSRET